MKKLLFFLGFFCLLNQLYAQTNLRDLQQSGGKFYTKDKVPYTGEFVSYDEKGVLETKGTLKDGSLNGIATTYYTNGNKASEVTYKDGITYGSNKDYYENGNLKQEVNTYNEKDDGKIIAYYETGEKHVEATFKNGVQVGDYIEYDKSGKITRKLFFENGTPSYGKQINDIVAAALVKARNFKNDDAIELYTKAIILNPTIAELYFNRGAAKANKFDYAAAIVDYDEAIKLYPDYKQAYANRGNAKINTFTSKGIIEPSAAQTQSACEDYYKAKELGAGEEVEDMIYVYCERKGVKPKDTVVKASGQPLIFLDTKKVTMQDMSQLKPNDVLEVTIVKNPTETAKYGSDGRNGVVLVTTINFAVKSYQAMLADYTTEYAMLTPDNRAYTLNGILLDGKPTDIISKLYALKKENLKTVELKKLGDIVTVNITTK